MVPSNRCSNGLDLETPYDTITDKLYQEPKGEKPLRLPKHESMYASNGV